MNLDEMNDLNDRIAYDDLNRTIRSALDTLAIAITDDDELDTIDAYELITIALAHALELCPLHRCDYRICADDNNLECAELRD